MKNSNNPPKIYIPWWDEECSKIISKRKRNYKKFVCFPFRNLLEYRKLSMIVRKNINRKKREVF